MSARKILIVTNGQLSRNPRPLKEAQTLAAAGYDVTILMVRNHRAGEAADHALLRDAAFRRDCIDLLPGTVMAFLRRGRISLARRLRAQSIHSLGPARALLGRAARQAADLTIVHNEVPHWVGVQLLARGRRVAADLEDWHSEDLLPADRAARPLALLRQVERDLLRSAAYTSTTSAALADALHAAYGGRRPAVIANSFPLQPLPPERASAPPSTKIAPAAPSFFWFSQTLGPGRGLEAFLAAWREMRQRSHVTLLGDSDPDYRARLLEIVPPERRGDVHFAPVVSPAALPAAIARHDVGLALEQPDLRSRDLTITNKILQYLNAGLAVVATDTAGQREVLAHEPSAGVIVRAEDQPGFTRALDELVSDAATLLRRRHAARRLAENVYCWEREAPRLLALVERALMSPGFAAR